LTQRTVVPPLALIGSTVGDVDGDRGGVLPAGDERDIGGAATGTGVEPIPLAADRGRDRPSAVAP